ncbi:hypothetical protein FEM48_Zijuj08G0091000 [Ziziphus jujuba var. spinosa]|uniref:RRM domain-containing protein n=1 Tax=Ziziphus jujuba var. spinosa TaxID=714518 RepID=A0A978UY77_ZIZJJ|nr:hypothetical protein FEM48_Zijuj08G0091000 [Ziziphus jujuba var. spinosa]
MRTRNADKAKLASAKKTPPARKSAVKACPTPPELDSGLVTPKTVVTKRAASTRARQIKKNSTTPPTGSKPEESSVEEAEALANVADVTPVRKVVSATKSAVKKTSGKAKKLPSAKGASAHTPQTPDLAEPAEAKAKESKEEVADAKNLESTEDEPHQAPLDDDDEDPVKNEGTIVEVEEPAVEDVGESAKRDQSRMEMQVTNTESFVGTLEQEKLSVALEEGRDGKEEEKEESRDDGNVEQPNIEIANRVTNAIVPLQTENAKPVREFDDDEGMEDGGKLDLGEHGDEELQEDDADDPAEENEAAEDEHRELSAIVKERKIKKEREIFVGGLDRDAVEEDVRRVFEKIGEIVQVRLHKSSSTNKNKGYAFVEYTKKEHARRALLEMKNPVICGKRCGTAPSEDNDTLFLGNICNTWTKEAIKQKLKDYGVEGVESITLVPDVQHEGLSRGFAFIEFSCHGDAMLAYKRLLKADAIFGHPERTAKVAFAEPLREPDPEVMAQVKSVFVDGLPPHWDEERVREQFKGYGEIVRIFLARNMFSAKRKDFGFVDFSTHEAAVACINAVNNTELDDGNSKIKVKARLSNPLPKTQAVKGGMSGGFRIGHGSGAFSNFGRGYGRGGNLFNFPRGRGFYQGGRGQAARMGFQNEYDFDNPYPNFHGRHIIAQGQRRGSFRGNQYSSGRNGGFNFDRPWHDDPDRGHGMHYPSRWHSYSPEGYFDRPFMRNHFDDPYLYGDNMCGTKRPLYMRDHDPDYVEPIWQRPRLDYIDPATSFHGNRYHDSYGAGSSLYSHDYYGPDYPGGPYSSFHRRDPSYGGHY